MSYSSGEWSQQAEIADVELAISVHEHDKVTGRCPKTRRQRRAITTIAGMTDQPHVLVAGCPASHELACAIAAAIVDDDDLVGISKDGECRQGLPDHHIDVRFFVERGENEGQAAGKTRDRRERGA